MLNLIRNENMKIYKRLRTWIMLAVLVVVIGISSYSMWHYDHKQSTYDWRLELQSNLEGNKQALEEMAKMGDDPVYTKMLSENIMLWEYMLENDIPPESRTMWGPINLLVSNIIMIVTIFSVIIAGDIIASEFSTGTIKLLAIRPIRRSRIIFSKYLATFQFAIIGLLVLYVVSSLFAGILYGFEGLTSTHLYISGGEVKEISSALYVWKSIGYECISLIMVVTLAFMISCIFRSSSMAIGLSIFLLLLNQALVPLLASKYEWMKYYLFTNVNLTQYLEGSVPYVKGTTLTFSITVLVVYFVLMNGITWLVFKKKDIAV